MHANEPRQYITGDQRLLREVGTTDFLRPAWGVVRQRRDGCVTHDLMAWCEECLQWKCHDDLHEEEQVAGRITERGEYCDCRIGGGMYCMGMADGELAKMLQRYPSARMKYTPPSLRRVSPVMALLKGSITI